MRKQMLKMDNTPSPTKVLRNLLSKNKLTTKHTYGSY
jgi:hypothetical protein